MSERGGREPERRVVLYGQSLVLASVAASLERLRRFEVTQPPLPLPTAAELEALAPDVVLFDVQAGPPAAVFSLLESRPELLVLGLDPDGNVTRAWSGRQYLELSTDELAALIESAAERQTKPLTAALAPAAMTRGTAG